VDCLGLKFPNPVGLAAGYDKDGLGWKGLAMLGFGHLEIGTVTPEPQSGNPRPRIFRVPEKNALVNRMGFPGRGSAFVRAQLEPRGSGGIRDRVILGVNIGKNKAVPNREAVRDYLKLVEEFAPLADYLAVNVSSPNTVGLRDLQARAELERLLTAVVDRREKLVGKLQKDLPVVVKLSPDLTDQALDDALDVIQLSGADGVIAANTTVSRPGNISKIIQEEGGLSGDPLREPSTELIRKISRRTEGRLPILGVGGIAGPEDARSKLDAGASLVQVYTGLIYQGPLLVRQILKGLA
jgi:dihydroorotate dehydrogenase